MKTNEGRQQGGKINSTFYLPLQIRIIKSKELSCLYSAGLYSMRVGMSGWMKSLNVKKKVPEKPVEYSEVWQENHCLLGTPTFQF